MDFCEENEKFAKALWSCDFLASDLCAVLSEYLDRKEGFGQAGEGVRERGIGSCSLGMGGASSIS